MMLFIFFFPAAQAFLPELLPIPDAIKFLCDGFLVLLLLKLFSQRFTKIDNYSMPFVVVVASSLPSSGICLIINRCFTIYGD